MNISDEQRRQIGVLEQEAHARLAEILTPEQQKTLAKLLESAYNLNVTIPAPGDSFDIN